MIDVNHFNSLRKEKSNSTADYTNTKLKDGPCRAVRLRWQTSEIDRGWSWIVAIAAFMAHFFTLGFAFSIGVYYMVFLDVFQRSKGLTAWISSLNFGILCAVGPMASIMISKYGCRTTMLCGSILSTAGLVTSAFAADVYTMLVSVGIVAGAGFGLVFASGVVVISLYFYRFRTLAMGLSLSGAGFGTLVYPWLSRYLINHYGWRGALMISASINFNICICAMMIKKKNNFIVENINQESELESIKLKGGQKKKTLMRTLNLDICSDFAYLSLCVNCMLFTFGMSVVYTHISAYTHSMKLGHHSGDLMISALGISNLLGRIGLGIFGQLDFVDTSLLFMASYFTAGFAIIICGIWVTLPGVASSVCTFGFFSGAFGPLLSEVTCVIVGVARFNHGYGYLMVFMAIGTVLGAPAAGTLYDVTHFYPASFYLGGCSLVLSAITMLPTYFCIHRRQEGIVDHATYIEPAKNGNHQVELPESSF